MERCCEGYKRYKHDRQYCVPKCSNKCQNGFCVAPNVCICFTDHVRNLDNECVTTCPIGCLNGHCHMNGTCTCNPGYTLDPNKKFCGPVCSKGCGVNANCTAPEQCSCLPGYQLNTTTGCEPLCIPNCGNGTCIEPNVCRCNAGFVLKDKTCQANCPRWVPTRHLFFHPIFNTLPNLLFNIIHGKRIPDICCQTISEPLSENSF